MSSLLRLESSSTIPTVLDSLASLDSFENVHVAVQSGELSSGVYSAMRTSPQLIFCVDGEATYWIRRDGAPSRITLRPGGAVVLPGGVWISVDPDAHYRTFGVSLFPEMIHCYLVQPGRRGQPQVAGARSSSFDELRDNVVVSPADIEPGQFERIDYLDELDRPSSTDQTMEQLIATLAINAGRSVSDPLLGLLLKALVVRLREAIIALPAPTTSKAEATYNRIRRFIIANCDKPLDRDQIGAAVGVHPRHVSNLFTRFSNETLSNFMLRARLERARRLLSVSDSSVNEVSALCGFTGPNHFVRAFRQRFGAPPGKYRRSSPRYADRTF